MHIAADIDRRDQFKGPLRPFLFEMDTVLRFEPRTHAACKDILLAGDIAVQIADIAPIPVGGIGVQRFSLLQQHREQILGEIKFPPGGIFSSTRGTADRSRCWPCR